MPASCAGYQVHTQFLVYKRAPSIQSLNPVGVLTFPLHLFTSIPLCLVLTSLTFVDASLRDEYVGRKCQKRTEGRTNY